MTKVRKKIFKSGKYPQGTFTKSDLKELITGVSSVPGILGHTSGWRDLKVPAQAIPIAGEFSNLSVVGDYIEADITTTEFGKKFIDLGALDGISIEIGKNNKLIKVGMLGAVPPQIKDLDSLVNLEYSEEQEDYLVIEFSEGEGGKQMDLQAILEGLNLEQKLEMLKLIGASITKDQKAAFRAIAYEFAEITNADEVREFAQRNGLEVTPIIQETIEQMEARLRAEIKQETLLNEFSEKSKIKVIPAMQNKVNFIAKELIKSTATEVEFSENEKGDLYTAFTEIVLGKEKVLPDANLEFGEVTNLEKGPSTLAAEAMWGNK